MPSIPNHQEIFVDRARDETVIVELVDAIEDRTGSSLGAFAFEDACDACDAIERRLVTSGTTRPSRRRVDAPGAERRDDRTGRRRRVRRHARVEIEIHRA